MPFLAPASAGITGRCRSKASAKGRKGFGALGAYNSKSDVFVGLGRELASCGGKRRKADSYKGLRSES
jgi:hypothetical protein